MKCSGDRRFSSQMFMCFYFRLESGLAPLVTDVSTKRSELSKMEKNLEEKTVELHQMQLQIDASSKLLK